MTAEQDRVGQADHPTEVHTIYVQVTFGQQAVRVFMAALFASFGWYMWTPKAVSGVDPLGFQLGMFSYGIAAIYLFQCVFSRRASHEVTQNRIDEFPYTPDCYLRVKRNLRVTLTGTHEWVEVSLVHPDDSTQVLFLSEEGSIPPALAESVLEELRRSTRLSIVEHR